MSLTLCFFELEFILSIVIKIVLLIITHLDNKDLILYNEW